jgi:hypothetical protein
VNISWAVLTSGARLDRKRGTPEHEVHLDLHLRQIVADHELDFIALGVGGQFGAVPLARERCPYRGQLLGDGMQSRLAVWAMVDKHKVDVD